MTASPLLSVRDLEVSYGPVAAVRGLSLAVSPGDVVALLGPNGAGKTSSLRAISGLEPHRGEVRFDGVDVRTRSPERLARRGLLHVPEGRRIFPTLTVHENLLTATAARGGRRVRFSPDDVYQLFPSLAALRDRGGWALSGGEQQMLAIGRALVGSPRVLLLDEPSLGLAPTVARTVFAALAEISAEVPMLVVEQNTAMALRVCSRAVVLAEGRVVLEGTPDELRANEDLLDSFLGQRDVERG
ncbi:MAG TPA: ABC transporter ATP-binding protein [Acidimicrobiales bacterium]